MSNKNTAQLFTIELDVDTSTLDGLTETEIVLELINFLVNHGITQRLITKSGPNGWPLIEFKGTREALEAYLKEWYDDAQLIDDATPVPLPPQEPRSTVDYLEEMHAHCMQIEDLMSDVWVISEGVDLSELREESIQLTGGIQTAIDEINGGEE